jgi:hypothetical protein
MKIGIGRIIRREIAILDYRVAVRKVRKFSPFTKYGSDEERNV